MRLSGILLIVCFLTLILIVPLQGAGPNSTLKPSSTPKSVIVKDKYPNIEMGFLNGAVVSDQPEGVLLKAGSLVVYNKDLDRTIAEADEKVRSGLKKYASLVLEQISIPKLLVIEIKQEAAKNGREITETDDDKIIQDYLPTLIEKVKVSDAEILEFYNTNKDSFGDATLAQIKPQIQQYLTQQNLQKLINERIRTIGDRMKIEISASWLKAQAALERDNPVNKARDNGKPTMVDFGSKGCVPCDMLAPILETLQEKYNGKANIVVVLVGEEPVLASRYGVEVIPLQIFYDKTGKEVFRHEGFYSQKEIEQKLSEVGVN
ncbi:MAG: thioredoxin family protein [Sedimentisphaerales bacterium]|nr:thioredoxin family protein [Sedimentisphaerales bacterium]